ncbi:MAG: L-seryl-tRNA(Sec) selenium transferase, partial [Nitriliruptoraceae bacterium]
MTVDRHPQLAQLPQVDALVQGEALAEQLEIHGRPRVTAAAREAIEAARERVLAGEPPPSRSQLEAGVCDRLTAEDRRRVRRVVNATGVVLHTNLGRAPLSSAARAAVADAAGYATVEYDLDTGGRGSRTRPVGELAAEVCG